MPAESHSDSQAKLLLTMVLLAFMGQMMLNPVIAPLSRAMGLAEWQIGATISAAALALVLLSQFWGRRSQRLGVKRTLVTAMVIALCGLGGFTAVAWLGVRGVLTDGPLFVMTLLTRGLIYGGAIAAIAPTVQAHLVTHAATESERVKAVGALGAAQGAASILGAVAGGVLAAAGGLLFPVSTMPVVMLIGIVILVVRFHEQSPDRLVEKPASVSFRDRRIFPYLVTGFLLFLGFSTVATLVGFAVQDRFHFTSNGTAAITAGILLGLSLVMAFVQGGVVRRLGWPAHRLLRVGFAVMTVSGVLLFIDAPVWVFGAGCLLLGAGSGLAMPGYTAGPTLGMDRESQGGLAGLINANNGLTYVIAPIGSTALYGIHHTAPFLAVLALFTVGLVFTFVHPLFRNEGAVKQSGNDAADSEGQEATVPKVDQPVG
ncbi:Metal-tetracycline/H(+) antiporter [Dermatophilus congolensis]|uniref:Metal-tetracycline/H(+) antiporter n=2 Tax=Dermatophilus congolensis TaxID=1863 RepID=A0AA46BMU5_9MICO|nr:Metal-tetracycline/H(+) antiporter [Dermatophilus congolensis]